MGLLPNQKMEIRTQMCSQKAIDNLHFSINFFVIVWPIFAFFPKENNFGFTLIYQNNQTSIEIEFVIHLFDLLVVYFAIFNIL